MTPKTQINELWREFRQAINATYAESNAAYKLKTGDAFADDGLCLKDYAEDISWHDDLAELVGRESAEERRHRSGRPSVPGFSTESAAKLLVMENARKGAAMGEMPRATGFLVFRKTAMESEVIGFIARKHLSAEWRAAVEGLDYAELMKAGY